jgi:hypothetical protein
VRDYCDGEANVSDRFWAFSHSVECGAPREFAWKYWTNPANWEDPPARFEFDGPFAVGTTLTTILPGQELRSVIRGVEQGSAALIEMDVEGATVRFHWTFAELAEDRTKITQRITLRDGSEELVGQARMLDQTVPDGMKRIAERMERAWKETEE